MAWTSPRTWVAGETVTSTIFNAHLSDDLTALFSGEPWVFPTLGNSWVDYDPGYGQARYRKVGPWVEMAGLIKNGATAVPIFNVAAAYRPTRHLCVSVIGAGIPGAFGYSELRVYNDGNVIAQNVQNNGYFSLVCRWLVA